MPLTAILGLKKGIPQLAAARMQRWALTAHGNEDGLSWLPVSDSSSVGNYEGVFSIMVR